MLPFVKSLNAYLVFLLFWQAATCPTQVVAEDETADQVPVPALRDLNGYFPFSVPASLDAWKARKSQLHKHLRVSLGLWPYPKRTPLNAVVHGLIDQGEYTIEKVYFESLPGFYVTGNLYKPKNVDGTVPGIISPHGHFPQGRFGRQTDEAIKGYLETGAESFRSNAKNNLQARSANLAKMGCVVFLYDMIGYADCQQISYEVAHRFSKQRPEMNNPNGWSLFSPLAELRLQNVMGLQAWNSIRALDFLESLPDVDPKRLGVTGASGGGTQTFIVCALDDRPAVAFPAVMVSTAMQGGCTCENCSYLRIGTGNVELAAMFAPKPMGLTAANDWTKEMATKGFPELQQLYELYDKKDDVQLTARIEFGHNYNQVSREAMYRWFKKHLKFEGEPVETEMEFLDRQQLTVFNKDHPRPLGGEQFERSLLVGLTSRKNYKQRFVNYKSNIETFVEIVMNSARKTNGTPQAFTRTKFDPSLGDFEVAQWDFGTSNHLPQSTIKEFSGGSLPHVLFISKHGFSGFQENRKHLKFIRACRDSMGVRIFNNGWISDADKKQSRRVNNPREALSYTLGYNAPQLARRADAWLSATKMTTTGASPPKESIYVVSLDRAGLEVALNAQELKSRNEVAGLVINTHGFRFESITDIRDPDLLPGAVKYGDLPGLLSLAAPKPMLLIGEDETSASTVVRAYELSESRENLTLIKSIPKGQTEQEVVLNWIKNREGSK